MKDEFFKEQHATAFENCLMPLLTALGWQGNIRSLKEAMPHVAKINTATAFSDASEVGVPIRP